MLTQDRLKELLHYDPETGVFTHIKARKKVRVGSIAGSVYGRGYAYIGLNGKQYLAHRLAWIYMNGTEPPNQVDHINRIKTDNRIANLRLATNKENHQNMSKNRRNTSGHVGVSFDKPSKKWMAQIMASEKKIHLGLFVDISEAVAARKAAEQKYHTFQHA